MPDNEKDDFNKVQKLALKLGEDGKFSKKNIKRIINLANELGGIGVEVRPNNKNPDIIIENFKGHYEAKHYKISGGKVTVQ